MEILIQNSADVNIVGENGKTALIWAAYHGLNKVAELLIENGADASVADNIGNTALNVAAERG